MSLAACADTTSNALNCIRIYFGSSNNLLRDSLTSRLQQWTWDYVDVSTWMIEANSSANNRVAEGDSIAVTSDGQNTDHIFYQDAGKQTVLAEYSGSGSTIADPTTTVDSITAAPLDYSLAATWANAAVVLNQNHTKPGELLFSSVNRNGTSQSYITYT